ncbi:MAG: dual specificity protein phosphatase [Dehalococcoidia bacterium]|nr:dual specificity protein phosphatase [Dehalococcoidia bacterium]
MNWINERLAVGEINDAMNHEELKRQGIAGVLGLNDFPTFIPGMGFDWHRVQLHDGPGNKPADLARALDVLDDLLDRHRTLLHCASGVSRAPFVAAAYLATKEGLTLDEALAAVTRKRPIANPDPALFHLWREYQTYRENGNGNGHKPTA